MVDENVTGRDASLVGFKGEGGCARAAAKQKAKPEKGDGRLGERRKDSSAGLVVASLLGFVTLKAVAEQWDPGDRGCVGAGAVRREEEGLRRSSLGVRVARR
jgi:hypothetical protein